MKNKAATPEPMPSAGKRDVLPEIIADLHARTAEGVRKYGAPLQTFNGRNALLDAYQETLDQAQYLKQRLMEDENPQPHYNFRETIFVRQNSLEQQLDHILSEVDEINQIGPFVDAPGIDAEDIEIHLHMEIVDLAHSIETYLRILENQKGPEYVAAIFQAVENKNSDRVYYEVKG